MIKFIIVLLIFTAGCATFRTSDTVGPLAQPRSAEQAQAAPPSPGEKIDQLSIQEKSAEPAQPVAAEPSRRPASQEEFSLVRQEPLPAPSRKPARPSLPVKEPPVPDYKLRSLIRLAAANDEKIMNVYVGMYRKTVEEIMGTAQNPYKRQKITGADGRVYEVLFYLTREPRKGRPITDRMLTPLIFRKGQIVAIGNYPLKKLVRTGTLRRKKPRQETPGPAS